MYTRKLSTLSITIRTGAAMKNLPLIACLVVTTSMFGCALTTESATKPSNDPIAEVTLETGTKISFFEPSPGAIAIGQDTALGVAPVATAGMSAVELYQSLAPGQPVPQAFVDAQARADQARIVRPSARSTPKASSVAGTSDFSSGWFADNHCYEDDGVSWHFINCHGTQLPTGSLDGTHGDIDEFRDDACANTATITLRVWVEDDQTIGVQLTPGHCYAYHWSSGVFNADSFRTTTTVNSAGDYGLAVKWNQ
jgi:hypothetical protein